MTIYKTIERNFKPTSNPRPKYKIQRCITTRRWSFDAINPTTGEFIGKTYLYWKHNTDDTHISTLYRGCSWRFFGYNPIPVTDWFYGLPIDQMLKWCEEHGLGNRQYIGEFKTVDYVDGCVWDECNNKWVYQR